MGKLIDTDDLKKILLEKSFWPVFVRSALEQIPEAVVRCKDCEYFPEYNEGVICIQVDRYPEPDEWCYWAKRRSADA